MGGGLRPGPVGDCVVVGGGIAGCTLAFELAGRGLSVTLFEQGSLAGAASGRNMGLLLNQIEPEVVRIMGTSLDIYREIEDAGFSFQLRGLDQLLLARDDAQMAATVARAGAMRTLGIEVEMLDGPAMRAGLPGLAEGLAGGALLRGAWSLDPGAATRAFAEAARAAGARIRTGVRVSSVSPGGIVTDDGRVAADAVFVAAGPWLPDLLPDSPVSAARGWVMRTARTPFAIPWIVEEMSWPDQDELGRAARPPTMRELAEGEFDRPLAAALALAPRAGGDALVGTSLAVSLREAVEGVDMPRRVADRAVGLMPGLAEVPVVAAWSGIRPMTPDGMPLAGRSGGIFVHGGHGSIGMMTAPATARWLVDQAVGSETSRELERLSPDRFAG